MTPESERLIATLEERIARYDAEAEEMRARGREPIHAVLRSTWADATRMALRDVVRSLPRIEEEARRK